MPERFPPEPSVSRPPVRTVLVVDDAADMRLYIRVCLEVDGPVEVIEAADGAQALALARALAFDLVISDVVMPGLGGLGLCWALKADPATASVPVLLISGATRGPPCADGFLEKPFNAAGLREAVGHLLTLPP